MPNPVVHFEYHSNNPKELQDFYSGLFGWHVDTNNPMDYGFVDTHAGGINGGITSPPDGTGRVVVSVEVDDLEAYLKKAGELGAKTVVPITEIPNVVTFAAIQDPQGNWTGLVKSADGSS